MINKNMNLVLKYPKKSKFKYCSKKQANFYNKTIKNQILQDSQHFICAIKALSKGLLTIRQLSYYILFLRKSVGRGRFSWPRIRITFCFNYYKTKKPTGHRMGHGKGKQIQWSYMILPGEIFLKVVNYSDQYVFFDSLSWTHLFSYLEYVVETHLLFFDTIRYYRKRKFLIYTLSFDTKYAVFSENFVRLILSLLSMYKQNMKSKLNCLFFDILYLFVKRIKLKLILKEFSFKLFIACLSIFFIFFSKYYRNDGFIQMTMRNVKFQIKAKILKFWLLKYWLFGLFFNIILLFFKQNTKLMLKNKIFNTNLFFSKNKLILLNFSKLLLYRQRFKIRIPNNNFIKTDSEFVYNAYVPERIVRYPKRNQSFLGCLFYSMRRIKNKVPFKSAILFPKMNELLYMSNKKKFYLKHQHQK